MVLENICSGLEVLKVDTLEAVRAMLEHSGRTSYRVAVEMGRAPSYVSSMLRRGSCPSADVLAQMADACGYDLRLVSRDGLDALTIGGRATD